MMRSGGLQAVIRWLHLDRFVYGEGPQAEPITLNHQRIFILPTREGLVFAGIVAAMLLGAMNYANSTGLLLTFFLAGFGLVSMLHTYRNMARLTFRAGHCPPVFAGDQARYTLLITNPSSGARFALTLALDAGLPTQVDLPARQITPVVVRRSTSRRGYIPMGRCTVSTRYPVGLFRAWAYVDLGLRCLVYPAPTPPQPLPPLQASPHAQGEGQGRGGEDFVGLRPYAPGDSPRHIAWKQTAHRGVFLTKQFAGDGHVQRWLSWDDVAHGDVETRLSVLCRWVLSAHAEGAPYGLRLPGKALAPSWSPAHRHTCLKTLALYGVE